MSLDVETILDKVVSHAAASGLFERVNTHEVKNPPGRGLTCEIWSDIERPIGSASGLDSVTVLMVLMVRIRAPWLTEPQDALEPEMVRAVDTLCTAYCGDFTLDGAVRQVDIFGAYGMQLEARAGYLRQDGTEYRIKDIVLPLVVNDVWAEAP